MTILKSTFQQAISDYCDYLEVDAKDIFGKCRLRKYVKYRHAFYYILRETFDLTLSEISEITNFSEECNRHHTTILNGINNVHNELMYNEMNDIVIKMRNFFHSKLV